MVFISRIPLFYCDFCFGNIFWIYFFPDVLFWKPSIVKKMEKNLVFCTVFLSFDSISQIRYRIFYSSF